MLAGAQPGLEPVSQKLAELGPVRDLTTGGYFEGSAGIHKLVTGLLGRRLSTAIVKANLSVLMGRLGRPWPCHGHGWGSQGEEAVGEDGGGEDEEGEGGDVEG